MPADAPRIMVFGGPKSGKSTLAKRFCQEFDAAYYPVEKKLGLGYHWGQLAELGQHWLKYDGPWVIEGLSVPRIIRRWLRENPGPLPCDEIWHLGYDGRVAISKGQVSAGKAVETVWQECLPAMVGRYAGVIYDRDGSEISLPELVGGRLQDGPHEVRKI